MRLKIFDGKYGLTVIRDGEFEGTGKLSTPLPGRLVPLRSERYVQQTNGASNVTAVLTSPALASQLDERLAVAVCDDPDRAHAEIHLECGASHQRRLQSIPTVIHPTASIDERASVSPFGVTIEAGAVVGPFTVVHAGVVIEEDVHIRANCTLGDAAFNLGTAGGRRRILPAFGGVRIRRGADIAGGVSIDAAMFGGETVIGSEVAIDHHAYIAHDVQVGNLATICGHAAIMGRALIGDRAYIGPGSVIINGATVGQGAKVTMGAVVTRSVEEGQVVTGNFALPHQVFLSNLRQIRSDH
ncbi:DapH/DapD/GlmU-related protein [Brevundimonas denitrificans]|uniref:DapH/DapD/GlmU-related protein n=2 Tax=Brevundimonas TaxID=41275 RepID=UPI0021F09809|nr:DapH/DapD/GlmU-related protein [Brevundimonas denitrificans]